MFVVPKLLWYKVRLRIANTILRSFNDTHSPSHRYGCLVTVWVWVWPLSGENLKDADLKRSERVF